MKQATRIASRLTVGLLVGLLMAWASPTLQAQPKSAPPPPPTPLVTQHNLVASDASITADNIDTNLVNPWGLVFNPTAVPWISDNGTGLSTTYSSIGAPGLVVTIPGAGGGTGTPAGIVFNGTSGFKITSGTLSGTARFIFASEDGLINAWSPTVSTTQALTVVDNSASGAVYKGLAMAQNMSDFFIYATDFHNNKVDVFDSTFAVAKAPGQFVDWKMLPGFAPFGIANIGDFLYVSYAKQDANKHDDVAGPGLGFVNVFNTDGVLVRRLATKIGLNSPWGMVMAPANFAAAPNQLLIGNFGDGTISVFDPKTGFFRGWLRATAGFRPLSIPGLWGLAFGNGQPGFETNTLFFTAGPAGESKGIFGTLK